MVVVTLSGCIIELEAIDREYRSGLVKKEVTASRIREVAVALLQNAQEMVK